MSSWPTLGNDAANTATTTAAVALWDRQTGSIHQGAHALFAGDDAAGAERGCTVIALTASNPTGGLLIAWFMSARPDDSTALTYLGQTAGLETDQHESIYTYSGCPDINQIPHSPIAIPPGLPALPDEQLGIVISIAAPGYEVQSGVGQDLAFGSTVPHGPVLVSAALIINPTAELALIHNDDPSASETFSIPFTPPAP